MLRVAQEKNEHYIFAQPCAIFPRLCMVIEHVEAIKKGIIRFSIQRIVFQRQRRLEDRMTASLGGRYDPSPVKRSSE